MVEVDDNVIRLIALKRSHKSQKLDLWTKLVDQFLKSGIKGLKL